MNISHTTFLESMNYLNKMNRTRERVTQGGRERERKSGKMWAFRGEIREKFARPRITLDCLGEQLSYLSLNSLSSLYPFLSWKILSLLILFLHLHECRMYTYFIINHREKLRHSLGLYCTTLHLLECVVPAHKITIVFRDKDKEDRSLCPWNTIIFLLTCCKYLETNMP